MKALIILMLCLSHSIIWADDRDVSELGRSLANYQACSSVSKEIHDENMFVFYQRMLNDIGLSVLSLQAEPAKQLYDTWGKSEGVLLKINQDSLRKICLSRFDLLSRQMANKISH